MSEVGVWTASGTIGDQDIAEAAAYVRRFESRIPSIVLILGSGLGGLVEAADETLALPAADIPGYPRSMVEGHRGALVFGRLAGRVVLFVQGRVHVYEGYPIGAVTFPVRLAHALGARSLVVTNAAGGINRSFKPGTLMFITDHISLWHHNRLAGGMRARDLREPRLRTPYDLDWTDRAEQSALRTGIGTRRGVYLWTGGPSYETKAEISAFARLGADAVGMSTVPEVIQACLFGMRVLGISMITNPAAGLGSKPLNHQEVLAVGRRMRGELERLIHSAVREAST